MDTLAANPWLTVIVPALLAALIAVLGDRHRAAAPWLAMIGPALVTLVGLGSVLTSRSIGEVRGALVSTGGYDWFHVGSVGLRVGWSVDQLAAVMLMVVGVVAFLVTLFSIGYMAGESGLCRYFALLSLFAASMSLLVIADGFVSLFIGWELVGACSYLLIGFWFSRPSAAAAAVKAFIVTRIGDVGLLLGVALLWHETGSSSYAQVFARLGGLAVPIVTTAAVLIAVGAIGKSAQFPLHIWLPDAMEGPTPVSALIHAATMVAAGVYLIARVWPVFEAAPEAQALLLATGVIGALGAATAAVAQTDIKKVLAYSTISQLGFMFAALGCGAWLAAFFHLVTHAAFKALLFLGAGSVIHATGTQELREMGGLRKPMPVTFVTWLVGSLALAGLAPFAGFFSKDEIVKAAFHSYPLVAVALVATAGLTAFYVARTTRLAFFDDYRGSGHPHEGEWVMTLPLIALAVLAAGLGFAAADLAEALGETAEGIDFAIALPTLAVTLVGLVVGWLAERRGAESDVRLEGDLGGLWRAMRSAWGWDALVTGPVMRLVTDGNRMVYAFVDRLVIDGSVEGLGGLARRAGNGLASLQGGDLGVYVALVVLGIATVVGGLFLSEALLVGAVGVVAAAIVASMGK